MDKIVEKFNLLDYINPVIAGVVFIAGMKYLDIHYIWAVFGETVWFDNIVIQTIILLIGFYLVGIVIRIRGLDGKPERMRALRGFHKVLFTAFLLLTLASAADCIYSGVSQNHYICFFASLLLSLIFLALYKRNEEYRFRMIMALYFEAENQELANKSGAAASECTAGGRR